MAVATFLAFPGHANIQKNYLENFHTSFSFSWDAFLKELTANDPFLLCYFRWKAERSDNGFSGKHPDCTNTAHSLNDVSKGALQEVRNYPSVLFRDDRQSVVPPFV